MRRPKPRDPYPPLSPEAKLRRWQEAQGAERDAAQHRADADMIQRAVRGPWRHYWPGMYVPPAPRGWLTRVLGALGLGG